MDLGIVVRVLLRFYPRKRVICMSFIDRFRSGRGKSSAVTSEIAADAAAVIKEVTTSETRRAKPLAKGELNLPYVDPLEAIFGGATPETAREIRRARAANFDVRQRRRAQMLGRG